MTLPLSPMERAILDAVALRHWSGWRSDRVEVVKRDATGVGVYVYLVDQADQRLPDGDYSSAHYIEMEGVVYGVFFEVAVEDEKLLYIELVTSGGEPWDGVERPWRLVPTG